MNTDALKADLAKYEAEIKDLNAKLVAWEEEKVKLITHGRRIEGIVAYLRSLLNPAPAPTPAPAPAPEAASAA